MDVVKITIWVPDQAALKEILSAANVEHDCGSPKRDSDGNYIINLYASPAEAQKITALNYRHEVDPNYGACIAGTKNGLARSSSDADIVSRLLAQSRWRLS